MSSVVPGFTALYKFDGDYAADPNSINTTAASAIGTPTFVAGKQNNAIDLQTGDGVQLPNQLIPSPKGTQWALSAWYKTSSVSPEDATIISSGIPGTPATYFRVYTVHTDGRIRLSYGDAGATVTTNTVLVSDGAWHHLALNFMGGSGTMEIYHDGIHNQTITRDNTTFTGYTPTQALGWNLAWPTAKGAFLGSMDHVYIYPNVLSQTDITSLSNEFLLPSIESVVPSSGALGDTIILSGERLGFPPTSINTGIATDFEYLYPPVTFGDFSVFPMQGGKLYYTNGIPEGSLGSLSGLVDPGFGSGDVLALAVSSTSTKLYIGVKIGADPSRELAVYETTSITSASWSLTWLAVPGSDPDNPGRVNISALTEVNGTLYMRWHGDGFGNFNTHIYIQGGAEYHLGVSPSKSRFIETSEGLFLVVASTNDTNGRVYNATTGVLISATMLFPQLTAVHAVYSNEVDAFYVDTNGDLIETSDFITLTTLTSSIPFSPYITCMDAGRPVVAQATNSGNFYYWYEGRTALGSPDVDHGAVDPSLQPRGGALSGSLNGVYLYNVATGAVGGSSKSGIASINGILMPIDITSSSDTVLTVEVPGGISSGLTTIDVANALGSDSIPFTIITVPDITGLSDIEGVVGASLTITGTNFDDAVTTPIVTFGAIGGTVTSYSATSIDVTIPSVSTGSYNITVQTNGGTSTPVIFQVYAEPIVLLVDPDPVGLGSLLIVSGLDFSPLGAEPVVRIDTVDQVAFIISYSNTSIEFTVDPSLSIGSHTLVIEAYAGNTTGMSFETLPSPTVDNVSESEAITGDIITITGANYTPDANPPVVYLDGIQVVIDSYTSTEVIFQVPPIPEGEYKLTVETSAGTVNGGVITVNEPFPTLGVKYLYLDAINGDDENDGDQADAPLATAVVAVSKAKEGTNILCASGNYGPLNVEGQRLRLKALKGQTPIFGDIDIVNGQCDLEGLTFNSGVTITNTYLTGAANIAGNIFTTGTAIELTNVKYISIHSNDITNVTDGILIQGCQEASINANTIRDTSFPITASGIRRLDFFHNTVDVADRLLFDMDQATFGYNVSYVEITSLELAAKSFSLPVLLLQNVALNAVYGPTQNEGTDFIVVGNSIVWGGYLMEGTVQLGDIFRVIYSSPEDLGVNDRVRLDSNNLTNILSGVQVVTGDSPEYTYNNWHSTPYTGIFASGNFSADPLYVGATDKRLSAGSPDIDAANPTRWDDVFLEVAPLNRNVDRDKAHRFYVQTGFNADVGSYERLDGSGTHTGTDYFIDESGFNFVHFGDLGDPHRQISRSMGQTAADPVNIVLKPGHRYVGDRRTTIVEAGIDLSNSEVIIHDPQVLVVPNVTRRDTVFIRPYEASLQAGSSVYVGPLGDDDTGDGSLVTPYRTIGKALTTAASNILVYPGRYPLFTGVAGKRIVGIPSNTDIDMGGRANSEIHVNAWGIANFGVSLDLTGSVVTFGHA